MAWSGARREAERIIAIAKKNNAREVRQAEHRRGTAAPVEVPQAGVRGRRPLGAELLHAGRRRAAHQVAGDFADHPAASAKNTTFASPTSSTRGTATSIRSCSSTNATPIRCKRVLAASNEILDECIRLGGSVTGEHGIGVEKIDFMPKLFSPDDLAMMLRLRQAFNPDDRCSPHKMLPTAGACIEQSKAGRHAAM